MTGDLHIYGRQHHTRASSTHAPARSQNKAESVGEVAAMIALIDVIAPVVYTAAVY